MIIILVVQKCLFARTSIIIVWNIYAFYRSIIVQKLGGCWGILNVFKKFKIKIIYTKLKLKLKFLLLIRVGIGEAAQQGPMMWLAYSVEWYGLLR